MKAFLKAFVAFTLLFCSLGASGADKGAKQKLTLTKDNTIVMDQEFNDKSVAEVTLAARALDARLPSGDALYLVMLSGGGSIDAGLELIENLRNLNRPVHTITIFAASMAFQTVQGLGSRFVIPNGTLMAHKAKGQFGGEFPGQFDSRYNYYLKRVLRMDDIVVARSGGKLTAESYRNLYANEFWCDGQECVDAGVADAVAQVSCDKSLDGTRTQHLELSFMGMPIQLDIKKAACPLITALLEVQVKVNGRNVNLSDIDEWKYNSALAPFSIEAIKALKKTVDQKVEEFDTAKHSVKAY